MNLIEALKQANGKPVRRHYWAHGTLLKESLGGIAASSDCGDTWDEGGGGFLVQCKGNIFGNDWYVVEPKSKIEEAIEGEAYDSRNNPVSTTIDERMRRIANIALDEAKKALSNEGFTSGRQVEKVIDSLKVKE